MIENVNQTVTVTLTQSGADTLNKRNKEMNEKFSMLNLRADYAADEDHRGQFWCLMGDFETHWIAGANAPFYNVR